MNNHVKVERLSPLLFEPKYEMESSPNISEGNQNSNDGNLQNAFMGEKSNSPSTVTLYPATAVSAETLHLLDTSSTTSNSGLISTTQSLQNIILPSRNPSASECCYPYMSMRDDGQQNPNSSPQSSSLLPSSSPSLLPPSSIACSTSIPCTSNILSSASIPSSSLSFAGQSTSSNCEACSPTCPPSALHSDHVSNLLNRDDNVDVLGPRDVMAADPNLSRLSERSQLQENPMERRDQSPLPGPSRGGHGHPKTGAGISDAVTKILDDVDWSIIPMANKYVSYVNCI